MPCDPSGRTDYAAAAAFADSVAQQDGRRPNCYQRRGEAAPAPVVGSVRAHRPAIAGLGDLLWSQQADTPVGAHPVAVEHQHRSGARWWVGP